MGSNPVRKWPYVRTSSREEFAAVFWQRVRRGRACWRWLGRRTRKGYGQITSKWFATKAAHRIAYELAIGPIPDGMLVCHRCDNPWCVNPAHLFVGTDQDNVRDMLAKGRSIRIGERNPRAKMTPEQIRELRTAAGLGVSVQVLALRYGLSENGVRGIIRRETWAHIEEAA